MLVVRVEVWPGGDSDQSFEISRVGIANVTGMKRHSSYEITALMGRDKDEAVVRSLIEGHDRETGWIPLVRRTMTNLVLKEELGREVPYDDPVAELLRRGRT